MDFLQFVRLMNLSASEHVCSVAKELIPRLSAGSDLWAILEQAVPACLMQKDLAGAEKYLARLKAQFKNSSRVKRLEGLLLEAQGKFDAAKTLYDAMITAQPANRLAHKRRAALAKARGDPRAFMEALSSYLDIFSDDAEAWLEMAECHLSQGNCAQAAFCYEELVLLYPGNPAAHARLAECMSGTLAASSTLREHAEGQSSDAVEQRRKQKDRLRLARLHASEAVRLSDRKSAYALAVLADVSFLHARACAGTASTAKSVQTTVLAPGGASQRTLMAVADLARGITAAAAAAVGARSGSAEGRVHGDDREDFEESMSLHRLARHHLAKLSSSQASLASTKHRDVFPLADVEKTFLSKEMLAELQDREKALEALLN